MKALRALVYTLICCLIMISCGETPKKRDHGFSLQFDNTSKSMAVSNDLTVTLSNAKQAKVDSVAYFLDDSRLEGSGNSIKVSFTDGRVGDRLINARIYSGVATYNVANSITLVADRAPALYEYNILETYPHDITAYTQGIEFVGDTLYESTGQYGKSSLRKTNYQTGEVYKNIPLESNQFGEGLTIKDNKLYQLTWKRNIGFVYELPSMNRLKIFNYDKSVEGWGLCNDGTRIYKSDGTERIWTLDNELLLEEDYIEVYTNTSKITKINELEWVEGKIYANVYERDAIAIIDPNTGVVEGVINTKGLKEKVTQHEELNVLNGISYKGEPNILYVTGKNWDKLFKIELIQK
ncbi:MAG: glutaminyl-peptide cyclotransferase [Gilvibacter sp.]